MKSHHLFVGHRRSRAIVTLLTCAAVLTTPVVARAWTNDSQTISISSSRAWAAPVAVSGDGTSFQAVNFKGSSSIGSLTLNAPGQNDWRWALVKSSRAGEPQWGTVLPEGSGNIFGVTADASGNSYVSGSFSGTVTVGSTTLASAGNDDAFVAKINSSGSVVWAVKFGGTNADWSHGVGVDSSGNVFFGGGFKDSVTFAGTTITSAGNNDFWIAKLNSSGVAQWVKRIGGTGDENGGWTQGIAVDSAGNAYISGQINSSFTVNGTSYGTTGALDSVVAKIDSSGNWVWLATGGSTASDHVYGIDVDGSGNVFVIGQFSGDASWGSVSLTNAGNQDAYVAKISSSGTWQWAKKIASASPEFGYGISVSPTGNVVATGDFYGASVNVDGTSLNNSGTASYDGWVAQWNSSGSLQWAHRFGGSEYDGSFGVGQDDDGTIFVSGESDGPSSVVYGSGSAISHLAGCTSDCYSSFLWALSSTGGVATTTTSSTTSTTSTTTIPSSTTSVAGSSGPTTTVRSTTKSANSPSTSVVSQTDSNADSSDGAENEVSDSPTTTVVSRVAPSADEVGLGQATAKIGGEKVSSTVTRESNRIKILIQDVVASIGGLDRNGGLVKLDADGNLRVKPGESIDVTISGLEKGSSISAWLFSDPIDLGTTDVSTAGEAQGTFVVPMSVDEGNHTLVFEMTHSTGETIQASLGMAVGALDNGGLSIAVPLSLLAIAVLIAVVLPVTIRRRRATIAS